MAKLFKYLTFTTSFFILLFLCLWQIDRMNWKKELIAQYINNAKLPPIENCDNINTENLFRKIVITKTEPLKKIERIFYNNDSKKYENKIYLAIKCANKNILYEQKTDNIGQIIPLPKKNIFYPKNEPNKNIWYNFDENSISDYLNLKVENYYIGSLIPNQNIDIRNNHLAYAITWGALAIINLFFIFHLKVSTQA